MIYTYTYSKQNNENIVMTITALITGIYHYFPLLTILCSLCLQQAPQLGWAFTWWDHTNIHSRMPWTLNKKHVSSHFFSHSEKSIHIPLPHISRLQISKRAPFKFMTIQPNHCSQTMTLCILTYLAIFFFEAKCTSRFTSHNCTHWVDFPSPPWYRGVLKRDHSDVAVHFWVVCAYHEEQSHGPCDWNGEKSM